MGGSLYTSDGLHDDANDFIYQGTVKYRIKDLKKVRTTITGNELNLEEYLNPNVLNTFFVRMNSTGMERQCIFEGDIIIVDKTLRAFNGCTAVCFDGEKLFLKTIDFSADKFKNIPSINYFKPLKTDNNTDFYIWGVASFAIHRIGTVNF